MIHGQCICCDRAVQDLQPIRLMQRCMSFRNDFKLIGNTHSAVGGLGKRAGISTRHEVTHLKSRRRDAPLKRLCLFKLLH